MTLPTVLWIDLRVANPNQQLAQLLTSRCKLYRETNPDWIKYAIGKLGPQCLIFDYDFPDAEGLSALRNTKLQFPGLPILMLTDQHCEDLGIWAFRVGVMDYMPSPANDEYLIERLQLLSRLTVQPDGSILQTAPLADQPIPVDAACVDASAKASSRIRQSCGISPNL